MADIFISYASGDRQRVAPLVERLSEYGWTVWWDRDLVAGPGFEAEIEAAIEDARCIVIAWSKRSIESRWCRAEAAEGLERGNLVPLLLDDVRPPLSFRGAHTANLNQWPKRDGELDAVIAGIERYLGEAPTVPPKRVTESNTLKWGALGGAIASILLVLFLVHWLASSDDEAQSDDIELVHVSDTIRVAVMTLRHLGNHEDGEWLAGGLTEQLRREMSGWEKFDVLPSALTRGKTLDELEQKVDVVIDGYIQNDADITTVVLDVIQLRGAGESIQQTISSPIDEPMQLQRQIAANLAVIFERTLGADQGLVPAESAWPEYLRFLHEGTFSDFDRSIYWLNRTLESDPSWTTGWATLALLQLQTYNHLGDPKSLAHVSEALAAAMKDPDAPRWYWAFGLAQAYGYGAIEQQLPVFAGYAEAPFTAQFYPQLMLNLGLNREAADPIRRLVEREPNQANYHQILAVNEALLGNFDAAKTAAERMVALNPPESYQTVHVAGLVAAVAGDYEAAEEHLATLRKLTAAAEPGSFSRHSREAYELNLAAGIAAARGSKTLMQPVVDAMIKHDRLLVAAVYLVMVGENAAAAQIMDAALAQPVYMRWSWWVYRMMMPEAVRSTPMILRIEQHLGYTPAARRATCLDNAARPAYLGYQCNPEQYPIPELVQLPLNEEE